jgi:hypothetical protein
MRTRVATDTATIVIFDPECLKHRLEDACDWWSNPDEEVAEVNDGNVLFLSTGTDGVYDVEIVAGKPAAEINFVEALVKNQSGRFFVGAGEHTSGEGLGPIEEYGNQFVNYPPGVYRVLAWMADDATVFLNISSAGKFSRNAFTDSPSIA